MLFSPRIRKKNEDQVFSFNRISHVSNNSETNFLSSGEKGDDTKVSANAIAPYNEPDSATDMEACSPVPVDRISARAAKKNLSDFVVAVS